MHANNLTALGSELRRLTPTRPVGRVQRATRGTLTLQGLADSAALGDWVEVGTPGATLMAEVVDLAADAVIALVNGSGEGVRLGAPAVLIGPPTISPDDSWIGRMIDPHGRPLDGRPLRKGETARPLRSSPPPAATRKPLGNRLRTGLAVFDTLLPLVRGQRVGLFSGSGVGKSSLLADFARGVEADIVVIALVGERGREVREFAELTLRGEARERAVLVVATSDQPPLTRRQALWSAMTVAEHFRDKGLHVLLLADSVTRFAEAHREVALASGEIAALRGFPPSMLHLVMSLAERAGPGPADGGGDITALFTVLVAGSDMDEPVADTLRGVLDGHVVLDREIAERGRFPAVDVLRSVSRSLPRAATAEENQMITRSRRLMGAYDRSEIMIQSGLYVSGSDPEVDAAVSVWPRLDSFLAERSPSGPKGAFERLAHILRRA